MGKGLEASLLVNHMLETALTAFTTFFAVIGPIDSAVLVASLTPNATKAERRAISLKAVAITTLIVLALPCSGSRSSPSSACRCPRSRSPAASSS